MKQYRYTLFVDGEAECHGFSKRELILRGMDFFGEQKYYVLDNETSQVVFRNFRKEED